MAIQSAILRACRGGICPCQSSQPEQRSRQKRIRGSSGIRVAGDGEDLGGSSGRFTRSRLRRSFTRKFEGSRLDARIHWMPKPYSKVTAYTRRTSREDASGGVGTFLADAFGARWRHAFTQRLELDTTLEYTVADYDSPRKDKYLRWDIGLTQSLTRWLDIGVSYQYLGRRSNTPGLDYDDQMCSPRAAGRDGLRFLT